LLSRANLAGLLGTSDARVKRLEENLVRRGWLRQIAIGDLDLACDELNKGGSPSMSVVELTRAGIREAARQLMLSGPQALRHHGLLGSQAPGRQQWLRHLSHTVGTNGVFVAMAQVARMVSQHGGDDALVEWRSAAASSRGRCRPDGFGVYRRGQARYGFFLEYDRGTERAREYAAKLDTYYRYRDTGAALRDYVGFPTILVVTTRAAAVSRFANEAYLAWQRREGKPLPLLLTTTQRIAASPLGVLAPIWRMAGRASLQEPVRGYWLPGGAPRVRAAVARMIGQADNLPAGRC
jgi:hypothetical protein